MTLGRTASFGIAFFIIFALLLGFVNPVSAGSSSGLEIPISPVSPNSQTTDMQVKQTLIWCNKWVNGEPMSTGLLLNTRYDWQMIISVSKSPSQNLTNVRLKEKFASELGVEIMKWYVDGVTEYWGSGDQANDPVMNYWLIGDSKMATLSWEIGDVNQKAWIVLHLWTDISPAGTQEFTSAGTYEMNSGAKVEGTCQETGEKFTAKGNTITLETVDASTTQTVIMNNLSPTVEAGSEQTVYEGSTVNFSGSFTDAGTEDTHTIVWDFGDGGTTTGTLAPSHVYCDNGVYTVALNVTDEYGRTGTDTLEVTVLNVDPTVEAGADQTVYVGDVLIFCGNFTDPGWLDSHAAAWDFGDGAFALGVVTQENDYPDAAGTVSGSHVYPKSGTYIVTLNVTDDDNGVSSDKLMVVVKGPKDIKADALAELVELKGLTGNRYTLKEIDKAIRYICRSLDEELWVDTEHLDARHGNKVFNLEKKAIQCLMKITGKKGSHAETAEVVAKAQGVIDKLIKADKLLSTTVINEAKNSPIENPRRQYQVNHEIARAERELAKAEKELGKTNLDKVICHLEKAWEHGQQAIKYSQK